MVGNQKLVTSATGHSWSFVGNEVWKSYSSSDMLDRGPPPRMPVVNKGLVWDSLLKNVIDLVVTVTGRGPHPTLSREILGILKHVEITNPWETTLPSSSLRNACYLMK